MQLLPLHQLLFHLHAQLPHHCNQMRPSCRRRSNHWCACAGVAAGVWVVLKVALCHIIAAHLLPAILGHVVNCTAAAAAAAAQQQHSSSTITTSGSTTQHREDASGVHKPMRAFDHRKCCAAGRHMLLLCSPCCSIVPYNKYTSSCDAYQVQQPRLQL
jgi:hypothetical protein